MFPIAVITDEISQDLTIAAELVKEFGGSALEICLVWEKSPHEFEADEIRDEHHIPGITSHEKPHRLLAYSIRRAWQRVPHERQHQKALPV